MKDWNLINFWLIYVFIASVIILFRNEQVRYINLQKFFMLNKLMRESEEQLIFYDGLSGFVLFLVFIMFEK